MINEKKIIKTLCKDKKIKEVVNQGYDAYSVLASRIFGVPVSECSPSIVDGIQDQRYAVARIFAKAIALKNSSYLIETNVAELLRKLFEVKIIVEVPVKTTATKKSSSTKKSTTKKK